jgi:hypothetical protein
MLRGIQPTIRLSVSDFGGYGRSRFVGWLPGFKRCVRLDAYALYLESTLALMPAAAPTRCGASRDCPVASCSAPMSVATVSSEALIALPGGPGRFTPAFPDPALLGNTTERLIGFEYRAITFCGVAFQTTSSNNQLCNSLKGLPPLRVGSGG